MNALIIDDEPMPAKHLREMIKQYCFEIGDIEIIHSPKLAIEHLEEHEYDLMFLDVEMPEMNGVELLKHVQLPKKTAVIFTTAYSEYALDAFKANATHYIMKPVEENELITAVRKSMLKKQNNKATTSADKKSDEKIVSVFDGEEYSMVKTSEIIRLEADGSYTKFVLKTGIILASKRMGYYQDKLDSKCFLRCHNSHVINKDEVAKLSKGKAGYVIMTNDDIVPISPSKKSSFEESMGL